MLSIVATTRNTPQQQPPKPLYNNFVKPTGQMGPQGTGPAGANAGSVSGSVVPPPAPTLNASPLVSGNTGAKFETPQGDVVLNALYFRFLCIVILQSCSLFSS